MIEIEESADNEDELQSNSHLLVIVGAKQNYNKEAIELLIVIHCCEVTKNLK